MTDDAVKPANNSTKVPGEPFKKGYDPRRWLKGRPKKPASLKDAEELVSHVIWDELSRTIKNPETGDEIDSLRLMIRSMIRSKATQDKILDRIIGKVPVNVDVTTKGERLQIGLNTVDYRSELTETEK